MEVLVERASLHVVRGVQRARGRSQRGEGSYDMDAHRVAPVRAGDRHRRPHCPGRLVSDPAGGYRVRCVVGNVGEHWLRGRPAGMDLQGLRGLGTGRLGSALRHYLRRRLEWRCQCRGRLRCDLNDAPLDGRQANRGTRRIMDKTLCLACGILHPRHESVSTRRGLYGTCRAVCGRPFRAGPYDEWARVDPRGAGGAAQCDSSVGEVGRCLPDVLLAHQSD
mmetsp:Transcript_30292/g.61860  ORF Transcript_30292/g.61860 Transcript_30292/m.61860 type:complete len:221 (+) Transcript_30292:442-1104(+)